MGLKTFLNDFKAIINLIESDKNIKADGGFHFNNFNHSNNTHNYYSPTSTFFKRKELVRRSREGITEATTYGSLIYWIVSYVVGTGLTLSANPLWDILGIDDKQNQKNIKKQIEDYVKLVCASEKLDYYENIDTDKLLRSIFNKYLVDGEVFILFTYHHGEDDFCPVKIRVVSTENVCNGKSSIGVKNVYDGIELDESGKIIAYHIAVNNTYDYSTLRVSNKNTIRVTPYTKLGQVQVIHIANRFDINDLRGIPLATNILGELEKISSSINSELEAMKLNASILGVVTRTIPDGEKGSLVQGANLLKKKLNGNIPNQNTSYSDNNIVLNGLMAGEDVKDLSTTRPNLDLARFVDMVVRSMASSHGVPSEVLNAQYGSNYSASKAAIQQFWKSVVQYRKDFQRSCYKYIYKALITEMVAQGRLKLKNFEDPLHNEAWLYHNWVGSSQPSLDPNKDVEASIKSIENGFTNRHKAARELNGSDFVENIETLIEEQDLMKNLKPNNNNKNINNTEGENVNKN